ncbi:hypothetical protein HanPSC8_Chr16g0742671 [Helianthus annuus]|nr:hypothetical protein HanPSC8_Chr16g0742671 [Helianthus annuus]
MEIAELNLIGDFEAGIKCLQNPSLLSNLSLHNKLPQYSFWTCGALIIAVFATFTNLFNKINLFIHQIRFRFLSSFQTSSPQQIQYDDDDFDFDFSDDDIDDDTPSSVAESDDEDYDSEDTRVNEVFRVEGSGSSYFDDNEGQEGNFTLRRRNRFSWSDFSAGKSVVQLWDSFGLGLDFEDDDDESGIAIWDLNRDVKLSSGRRCQVPASVAEKVVLTAEMDGSHGGVGFGTYDSRMGVTCPAVCATWQPRRKVE